MHYKRNWRHGDVDTVITPRNFEREECSVDGCVELTYTSTSGLCKMHWQRMYRFGRLDNIRGESGKGYINAGGYRVIPVNGKPTYEHIYVAELALGRPLPEGAVVHHMNEIRTDNYTSFNLIICPDQAYHLLLHRRAKELNYNRINIEDLLKRDE